MPLPLVGLGAALGIQAVRQGIPHLAKYFAKKSSTAVQSAVRNYKFKQGAKKGADFNVTPSGTAVPRGQRVPHANDGVTINQRVAPTPTNRSLVPVGSPKQVGGRPARTATPAQSSSRELVPYKAPASKMDKLKGAARTVGAVSTAASLMPKSSTETPKVTSAPSASTASAARASFAASDPRRTDNKRSGADPRRVDATPAKPKTRSLSPVKQGAVNASASVKPVQATVSRNPYEENKATVKDLGGGGNTASVTASSAASEPEITMKDIMAKFSVADAKKVGLDTSNAELKANPQTFKGSFQRFTEGNIDQEGSTAYNKYGAGRGYQELLKKAKAKKSSK